MNFTGLQTTSITTGITKPLIWLIVLACTILISSNWFISFLFLCFDFFSTSLRSKLCLCQFSPRCSLFISFRYIAESEMKIDYRIQLFVWFVLLFYDSIMEKISCVISKMHCFRFGMPFLSAGFVFAFVCVCVREQRLQIFHVIFHDLWFVATVVALTKHFRKRSFRPHSVRFYWTLNVN